MIITGGITLLNRHADRHRSQVRHLLPLEPIQVCLDRRRRVLQVLRRQMKRILQLSPSTPLRQHVVILTYHTVTHLRYRLPRLRDRIAPRRLRIHIHHPMQCVAQCTQQSHPWGTPLDRTWSRVRRQVHGLRLSLPPRLVLVDGIRVVLVPTFFFSRRRSDDRLGALAQRFLQSSCLPFILLQFF